MSRKLNPKQRKAIILLSTGNSSQDISRRLEIRPETVSRWRKLPEFQAGLDNMRDEMRQYAMHCAAMLIDRSIISLHSSLLEESGTKRYQMALTILASLNTGAIRFPNNPPPDAPEPLWPRTIMDPPPAHSLKDLERLKISHLEGA